MKTKPLSKTKKIIDAGEWYNIIFKFGDISNTWVCQKDLLKKELLKTLKNYSRLK